MISLLTGILLGCVQIHYQSSEDSPFDKYYGIIKAMMFPTLCVYAAGFTLESKLEANGNSDLLPTVKIFTRLFGFLLVILLILLLLPWFGLFLLALWTLLFVKAVLTSYDEVLKFIKRKFEGIRSEIFGTQQNELPRSGSLAVNVSNSDCK